MPKKNIDSRRMLLARINFLLFWLEFYFSNCLLLFKFKFLFSFLVLQFKAKMDESHRSITDPKEAHDLGIEMLNAKIDECALLLR